MNAFPPFLFSSPPLPIPHPLSTHLPFPLELVITLLPQTPSIPISSFPSSWRESSLVLSRGDEEGEEEKREGENGTRRGTRRVQIIWE